SGNPKERTNSKTAALHGRSPEAKAGFAAGKRADQAGGPKAGAQLALPGCVAGGCPGQSIMDCRQGTGQVGAQETHTPLIRITQAALPLRGLQPVGWGSLGHFGQPSPQGLNPWIGIAAGCFDQPTPGR